jgi:hypothetical protein
MTKIFKELFDDISKKSDKWNHYFDIYQKYLGKYEGKNVTFIEVGVQYGGSLEMWSNFFGPESKLYGIDVDPFCSTLKYDNPNIKIIIGDQGNPNFWNEFLPTIGPIDIFLDDGGHHMFQQILTFENVWPSINTNGIYMCEDTHTSYFSNFRAGYKNQSTFVEYAKDFVDLMNMKDIGIYTEQSETITRMYNTRDALVNKKFAEDVSSVHFYDSMIIFEKEKLSEKKRVIKEI